MRCGRINVVFACAMTLLCLRSGWSAEESQKEVATTASGSLSSLTDDAPIVLINDQLADYWNQHGITPSPPATDGEWCRRVYLDLLGRIPTVEELQKFLQNKSSQRRADLVDRLLNDPAYTGEYAKNWTTIWTNILIGRTGGMEDQSLISRAGMQAYLREVFATNRRYDQFVMELITATGTTTPGHDNFNGATNFLCMKLSDNGIQATAKTAQLFLGMQVQCTQCHNHPFNEWKQNQFWELNAFFRQTVALRRFEPGTDDLRTVELTEQDFGGEGSTPEDAEIYYELRNGVLKAAYPVFVDGNPLENRSGFIGDVNRRAELGRLVIHSPYLSQAIVNRMWGHFLGYGFTKPVDDMGPHNPPSHPELLTGLATAFAERQYDLKQLIRWITLSRPYGLSSRITEKNQADDPALGEPPQFSHFYLRQMRAEELYESLLIATQADKSEKTVAEQEEDRSRWLEQFNIAFGTDEGDETTTFNGTIPQSLMMFNGELIRQAIRVDTGNLLTQVISAKQSDAKKIEHLFLAGLARRPTKEELQAANQLLAARVRDHQKAIVSKGGATPGRGDGSDGGLENSPTAAALQDVWWAILNSNEFILNH